MASHLFPRRKPDATQYIDHFCHYDESLKKHLICSAFYFARLKGEIVPSTFLGTWMIPGDVPREMSWSAKYYAGERGNFEDNSGSPFARFDCPWCGGETRPISEDDL
jgi:hypothetical protein